MLYLPNFNRLPDAIAIDLDGTLLDTHGELSLRNHSALENSISMGIPVIIATSRPARIFNRIFPKDMVGRCSYILMNGAFAKGNPPLSGRFREPLPDSTMHAIISCALEHDPKIRITIEIDGFDFGVNWKVDHDLLWQRNSATPDMVVTVEEALKRNPCKIAFGGTDIVILADLLRKRFSNSVSVVVSSGERPLVNITSPAATKPAALRRLLAPHGVSLDRVLAFGDDFPDIEMLLECGISVAMANSLPEVTTVCRYQTASNDEDGVALVLEKMLGLTGR
jgi:Cof subfamily protein (haloacid dehalogenase superfamily)